MNIDDGVYEYRLQDFPPVEELEALKSLEVEDVDNRLYHRFPHPDHVAMVGGSYLTPTGVVGFTYSVELTWFGIVFVCV
jgi:hypothetical protein